ncbi:MAG: ABC transporter permease [Chloroflexi bacterium]|nr:ABC transporter permease [Chloroflexota bacterium]
MDEAFINTLRSIVANATPLIIASTGETINERAGVINLSLDGSLALAAMSGFVLALTTNSILIGLIAAMLTGAVVAWIIAFANITLRQDQVAVGFVLTILCADLARFLGQDYTRIAGPQITRLPIPFLADIPIVGPILFQQNLMVYLSYLLVFVTWFWLFRTRPGMVQRAIGERPEAAFARGVRVNRQRYLYTLAGGALVGLAGAAYSLNVKPGLSNPPSMQGDGWIALAIVIFAGWHPFRVLLGAYLFAILRAISSDIQTNGLIIFGQPIEFNFVLLNGLPWILMLVTLLLVSRGRSRLLLLLPRPIAQRLSNLLRSDPPSALGTRFEER